MIFSFDVLIKEEDFDKVDISEVMVEWGGELFSQSPPKYIYDSTLVFERFLDMEYYKKYHEDKFDKRLHVDEYIPLRLYPRSMLDLEFIVNTQNKEIYEDSVIKFLQKISALNTFVIFLERDEECIDIICKVDTEDELIETVCKCLNWDNPQGALIMKV